MQKCLTNCDFWGSWIQRGVGVGEDGVVALVGGDFADQRGRGIGRHGEEVVFDRFGVAVGEDRVGDAVGEGHARAVDDGACAAAGMAVADAAVLLAEPRDGLPAHVHAVGGGDQRRWAHKSRGLDGSHDRTACRRIGSVADALRIHQWRELRRARRSRADRIL